MITAEQPRTPLHATPIVPQEATATTSALPPADPADTIAAVFLKAGLLTDQQLMYAKRVRAKLSTPKTLLSVLKELRYLTNEQIQPALSAQPTAVSLGDLLVELGYLQKTDLEAALNLQKETAPKKKLGQILVEHRFIDPYKLAEALSYQLGLPYVELQFATLDQSLLAKGSLKWYSEHGFLPLYKQDGRVLVAFSDPLAPKARELAEKLCGKDLLSAVTTRGAIDSARHLTRSDVSVWRPRVSSPSSRMAW
jgi:type IV pilus assembly protein PilB